MLAEGDCILGRLGGIAVGAVRGGGEEALLRRVLELGGGTGADSGSEAWCSVILASDT